MRYMFTMMNQARLEVGLEGLSIAERAYEHAAEYAKDRVQGRTLGSHEPARIIDHADVRRMLMTMKAYTEAMRCLVYDAVAAEDRMHAATDEGERAARGERLALLTPIAKAWCSDRGVEVASIGVQVLGGAGFIEESGAAQFYRDARITPIYEGTNGIQALDLVMRKLPMGDGSVIDGFLGEIEDLDQPLADGRCRPRRSEGAPWCRGGHRSRGDRSPQLVRRRSRTHGGCDALSGDARHTRWRLLPRSSSDRRTAQCAEDPWMASKVATARFYAVNLLPKVQGLLAAATGGSELLFAVDDDHIGT